MRVFLLPISTRRTLLYAHRLNSVAQENNQTWMEKAQNKASKMWAGWESKESGWQKKIVNWGNTAFRRIPYEEWSLKSVPPLWTARRDDELKGDDTVAIVYPPKLMAKDKIDGVLHTLSTEREGLHRKRMVYCFIGMPISAPFALVPVIPNLPFFYLVYRAWSHYRALAGGEHIQFLLEKKLLTYSPSPILDAVYKAQTAPLPSTPKTTAVPGEPKNIDPNLPEDSQPDGEVMLMSQESGKKMTQALDLPQLEVELERAIWQVESAIAKQNADRSQKVTEDAAAPNPDGMSKEDDKKSQ